MADNSTAATAAAAGPTPTVAVGRSEDAVQDGGDAIDTFSSYIPTALPPCIVQLLKDKAAASTKAMTTGTSGSTVVDATDVAGVGASIQNNEVIELLDSDDDDATNDNDNRPAVPITKSAAASSSDTEANAAKENNGRDSETLGSRCGKYVIKTIDADASASSSSSSDSDANKSNNANDDNTTNDNDNSNLFFCSSSHTSPSVESALLSSVSSPTVPDEAAKVIYPLVQQDKLSPLQAEGVLLAIHRFQRVFRSGGSGGGGGGGGKMMRAGFFIGDGAGIGKGRQISAILLDALSRNQGGGRHLWMSVSRELIQDARRDLTDVGCHVTVHDGAEMLDQTVVGGKKGKGLGAGGSLNKGVLFVTYSLLVSGKRMEDIISWLSGSGSSNSSSGTTTGGNEQQSYSGVIVFDEAHKGKNLESDTRTAKLVLELQERLPNARVLYCSATGVSDIKHMIYATRLGLWGCANPLYPTFESFQGTLAKRGVGAMEMLALEMKRKGIFLARTLSWDGAEFHTMEVKLDSATIATYDGAVQWWVNVKEQVKAAFEFMNISAPALIWRTYWSAHQRFFRELCICAKIDEVIVQAKQYLENGDHSIVIGLQSTGEAGMEAALEELAASVAKDAERNGGKIDFEDMTFSGLVSTCASVMMNFVRNHFPIALPPPDVPKVPAVPPNGFATEAELFEHARLSNLAERLRNEPPPEPIPELVKRRSLLLDSIRLLDLPPNPLDDLIDKLGGEDNVAEMTGRNGRILRNKFGKYKYVKRYGSKQKVYGLSLPNADDENDRLNIIEKKKFMEGKKNVAIISDAASTGISLHADKRCSSSHKRRVHFTIELPWAADKAIQQLGRSHRSGQVTAPIYKMVVTELGGEWRFASAVSKRMAHLGALTKGDRRAATGTDLHRFDIDSIFGRRALSITFSALGEKPIKDPCRNSTDILDKFIATVDDDAVQCAQSDNEEKRVFALTEASKALIQLEVGDVSNVKSFLNRLAGLDVARQNLVFSLFMATLDDVIADAKATGEFEGSVEEIRASRVTLKGAPEVIAIDTSCGAVTTFTRLVVDRGICFDKIIQTIVNDDESGRLNKSKTTSICAISDKDDKQCKSGFYISRRMIAGRHLIMFAQRKVAKDDVADFIDPLNLMIISRPNTGKNPCEMSSHELRNKYKLLLSSDDILNSINLIGHGKETSEEDNVEEKNEKDIDIIAPQNAKDAVRVIRRKWGNIGDLWDDAYSNSNFDYHNDGLAPRISEIGLVTGAVLHVLPSLEKAVQFLPLNQRSLRVIRAELTGSGQRIVGIKFPVTDDAITRLMLGMQEVATVRKDSLDSPSYVDEVYPPVSERASAWAMTERKTMKSFFGVAASKSARNSNVLGVCDSLQKRKDASIGSIPLQSQDGKKQKLTTVDVAAKKTSKISSFFPK